MFRIPLRQAGLILVLFFSLPAIIYTVNELVKQGENEILIRQIYQDQLNAVLYSVNQYSDDIVTSWANKLDQRFDRIPGDSIAGSLQQFINEIGVVEYIFLAKGPGHDSYQVSVKDENIPIDYLAFQEKNAATLTRLTNYMSAGFRKIEPFGRDAFNTDTLNTFVFKLKNPVDSLSFCALVFDPEIFIKQILASRFNDVAGDQFILASINRNNGTVVYATDSISLNTVDLSKSFWLLPGHDLAIDLKGESIEGLVKRRSRNNIAVIIGLDVILILGIWLVYRNVRRQVQLAQIKSDFVSNVSHEIRTPISLINMFAETLRLNRVKTEEKKKEYYDVITQEANRLAGIVNRILNFSQIEKGKRVINRQEMDLNVLINSILKTYQYHLERKEFHYSFKPVNKSEMIHADPELISEMIINLIDNAIKYSRDTKELIIRTDRKENKVILAVADKGIGMEKKYHELIFDKFYRITDGLRHDTKGTGLGLAMVKQIVDSHEASISVNSKKGHGTTFIIEFALKQEMQ